MQLLVCEQYEQLSRRAAVLVQAQLTLKPDSVVGFATGSTPLGLYRLLAQARRRGEMDASGITAVNRDEYYPLSPGHPQSYRTFMQHHVWRPLGLRPDKTHIPRGDAPDPQRECRRYDELLRRLGPVDLQLLGLGRNGHIGFNEPGAKWVAGTHLTRLTASTLRANARFFSPGEAAPRHALTMGAGAIFSARRILLLVTGAEKAAALRALLHGPITPQLPASLLQLHPAVTILADRAAAGA